MANKSPKLLSRNSLFFSTQNVILTVVCVFPERDIFKGYNTDWMVAILKWGVCKENLCLSLEELTVKRHSYLGGFVPSHIELQEMVLKYTHFFCRESWWVNLYFSCFVCRERTLWFPITSLNSTVMDRALFPCVACSSPCLPQRRCGEVSRLMLGMVGFPWSSDDG